MIQATSEERLQISDEFYTGWARINEVLWSAALIHTSEYPERPLLLCLWNFPAEVGTRLEKSNISNNFKINKATGRLL